MGTMSVGVTVGDVVSPVGAIVGGEGALVGAIEGKLEGCEEGAMDGWEEGAADGANVHRLPEPAKQHGVSHATQTAIALALAN